MTLVVKRKLEMCAVVLRDACLAALRSSSSATERRTLAIQPVVQKNTRTLYHLRRASRAASFIQLSTMAFGGERGGSAGQGAKPT